MSVIPKWGLFAVGALSYGVVSTGALASPIEVGDVLTLESEVRAVHWQLPQVSYDLAIPDAKGGTQAWTVTAGSLSTMTGLGWTANTLKVGDHVDAIARGTGFATAQLLRVVFSDGHSLNADASATTLVYPPLEPRIVGDVAMSEDPMTGYYGNTVLCQGASWECHAWFNPDHRFLLFSVDQQSDGSRPLRGLEGTYWLEKLQGAYFMCFLFDQRPIAPICHSPFNFEKLGDQWQTVLPNGSREIKRLVAGHQ